MGATYFVFPVVSLVRTLVQTGLYGPTDNEPTNNFGNQIHDARLGQRVRRRSAGRHNPRHRYNEGMFMTPCLVALNVADASDNSSVAAEAVSLDETNTKPKDQPLFFTLFDAKPAE